MMDTPKKKIPVREGLWTTPSSPDEKPQLLGSRCPVCGEIFFPKKDHGPCINCQSTKLEEVKLSRRGKIYSYTVVMQRPPVYYQGDVPYALGYVELPEGVRVESLLAAPDLESLRIGMDAELVIERLHDDEAGNEVMTYKFKIAPE
jgi:uncharacterized OB-fold protein